MKIDRILKLVVLATLIIGCAQKSNEKKDVKSQPKIQEVVVNRIEEPTVEPRLIVKSAIASIMNREPETITVDGSDGLYFAYYQKPSDEKIYEYKFMIDGKNIMWGIRTEGGGIQNTMKRYLMRKPQKN